jgi:hypothetical protein
MDMGWVLDASLMSPLPQPCPILCEKSDRQTSRVMAVLPSTRLALGLCACICGQGGPFSSLRQLLFLAFACTANSSATHACPMLALGKKGCVASLIGVRLDLKPQAASAAVSVASRWGSAPLVITKKDILAKKAHSLVPAARCQQWLCGAEGQA